MSCPSLHIEWYGMLHAEGCNVVLSEPICIQAFKSRCLCACIYIRAGWCYGKSSSYYKSRTRVTRMQREMHTAGTRLLSPLFTHCNWLSYICQPELSQMCSLGREYSSVAWRAVKRLKRRCFALWNSLELWSSCYTWSAPSRVKFLQPRLSIVAGVGSLCWLLSRTTLPKGLGLGS
jgi:hypothetical protein